MSWFYSIQAPGDVSKINPTDNDFLRYSSTTRVWELVNQSVLDAKYVEVAGDTMTGNLGMAGGALFDAHDGTANALVIYGGDASGDDLKLYANATDATPYIALDGLSNIILNAGGSGFQISSNTLTFLKSGGKITQSSTVRTEIYGGTGASADLTLYSNSANNYPNLRLNGSSTAVMTLPTGFNFEISEESNAFMQFNRSGSTYTTDATGGNGWYFDLDTVTTASAIRVTAIGVTSGSALNIEVDSDSLTTGRGIRLRGGANSDKNWFEVIKNTSDTEGCQVIIDGSNVAGSAAKPSWRIGTVENGAFPLTTETWGLGAGGVEALRIGNLAANSQPAIYFPEITTPTAIANFGSVYTKTDDRLYFQDGDGDEHQIAHTDTNYAEMYWDANGTATTIETANTPILIRLATTGSVNGWTFNAGSTGAISAYADYSGTVAGTVKATCTGAHNLATGDEVSIRGTTSYNGIFTITVVDADEFYFTDTWVADDGASDWDEGSYLEVGAAAAGDYALAWSLSATEGGAAGSDVYFQIYTNATACGKCVGKRKFANNDYGNVSGHSVRTFAVGDRLYMAVTSDGTNAITFQYGNLDLHRL